VAPGAVTLREWLEREGWAAAYREGTSLSVAEVAALATALLEDVLQKHVHPDLSEPPQRNELPVSPQVAQLPQPSQIPQSQPAPPAGENPLSEREREVLRLVADGLSNKAIGRQLFISANTVSYHVTSIFHKLTVDTRAQAVAVAVHRGLL
jgi:LuxR family transcriptional regulator, maltose regulon positive regulatory protein